ncbi:SGNH hydrolase domain-containing protein [Microbacterium esteraromaticum]|uniref:SGNH hydrolase domain-containing protein n=1 Tax=Microbacterium esteraromaticum TaxID=57043 RepID=UPI00195C9DCD|nr:peptidoglycan/LPS O-acetylase OafA/YrhL [Microbacterium esteraromaticum]
MTTTTAEAGPLASRRDRFRADIQGLRAIAVGAVLLYHAGVPFITGGYVGVDIFFVISGFLISTHLLQSLEREGRIGFADFYARRIRRILPASLVVAILTAVAIVVWYPPLGVERVLRDGLATVLYVPNIWFAIQNTDYLADHSPSPYQHYWSLGVEEQFYLLWPLILLLMYRILRRTRMALVIGIAVLAAASMVAGILLTPANQPAAFFLLPTRAWELLLGGLVGIMLLRDRIPLPEWVRAAGGWAGLALVAASVLVYDEDTVFPGTAAILPALGTAVVILCGAAPARFGPSAVLSIRPMQFVGLISYSLYLVHWPLLVVTQAAVGEQHPLSLTARVGMGIVLALPLAWLLFRFVETPTRSPRILTSRRPRVTLWTALVLTAALAAGLGGSAHWASVRDVGTGPAVAEAPAFPDSPPQATEYVPRNMRPALDRVSADVPAVYADGCHWDVAQEEVQECVYGDKDADHRVAVFGDSHSAQWLPAVQHFSDTAAGIAVSSYTKSSCPAVDVTVLDDGVPYQSCDRWRASVLEHLTNAPPDLVVISSYAWYTLADATESKTREQVWAAGLSKTVRRLEDAGSAVLVIADTPRFSVPPATCVSASVMDVSECDGRRADALDPAMTETERAAVEAEGGTYLNLNDAICGADRCPVIIDDLFVYRDVNHLTATFVSYLGPAVAEPMASLLGVAPPPAP